MPRPSWAHVFAAGAGAQGKAEAGAGAAGGDEYYTYAQVLLNWGNFLYERSQLASRAGQVRTMLSRLPQRRPWPGPGPAAALILLGFF